MDARWTKKNNKRFFGFKLHTLTDAVTKIVLHDIFTPANIHDVNQLLELCNHAPESMVKIYADSGYCSEDREQTMSESGLKSMFIKRPYSHLKLPEGYTQKGTQLKLNTIYKPLYAKKGTATVI